MVRSSPGLSLAGHARQMVRRVVDVSGRLALCVRDGLNLLRRRVGGRPQWGVHDRQRLVLCAVGSTREEPPTWISPQNTRQRLRICGDHAASSLPFPDHVGWRIWRMDVGTILRPHPKGHEYTAFEVEIEVPVLSAELIRRSDEP
jgi:hypothetical protein